MRTVPRTRRYVSSGALTLCRPVLSFDYAREAYTLRGIGDRVGPVLREDRRRSSSSNGYEGPERRGSGPHTARRSPQQLSAVQPVSHADREPVQAAASGAAARSNGRSASRSKARRRKRSRR